MKEFFTDLMNQLCFYPLGLTAATLFAALAPAARPSLLFWMLCALPVFALYYVRKRCRHLWVLIFLHFSVLVILYLIPAENEVNGSIRMLTGIGFVIYSLWLRFQTENYASEPLPLPLAAGIALLGLFLQHYQGNRDWDLYYRMSLILVFLLYAVILFLQSYEDFLAVNRLSTGKIPFQEIFHSGIRGTTIFVLFSGILLFIISQFAWLKPFLQAMREGMLMILRFLFGLIPDSTAETESIVEQNAGGSNIPLPEPDEPFILWVILEYVAIFALLAVSIFLLWRGIRRLISFLRDKMQIRPMESASEKKHSFDKREKLDAVIGKNEGREQKNRFSFLFPDAGTKIRHMYQKKITNSGLEKSSLLFYTARDAEKFLDVEGMAVIYEKARYSEEVCNDEDVRRMRDCLRKR